MLFQFETFFRTIKDSKVSKNNYDTPESGLDGLLQVFVLKTIISCERTELIIAGGAVQKKVRLQTGIQQDHRFYH